MNNSYTTPYIVLFDGQCNLCNHAVQFIIERDPKEKFKFASLQSETGHKLLNRSGMSTGHFDTVVLIKDNTIYTRSSAALRIAKELSGIWKLCYALILLPKPVRDYCYSIIAKNRHRIH